jgi:hypothetical protein
MRTIRTALLWGACLFSGLASAAEMTVYRSPTCGCCSGWVEHMREAGFDVTEVMSEDLNAVKAEHDIPHELAGCHTAVVDGYLIEGHVPAEDVRRLLEQGGSVRGLAVPGMPVGSPGMEVPGRPADSYQVIEFGPDGHRAVFAEH